MLTLPELTVIGIIILLFILIFATRLKTELIAIIILLVLVIIGLVPAQSAISGFSSSVVVTLIGLFIITHALEETGVVQWIAQQLNDFGQGSEIKLITLFMAAGAGLSLIMNNVAAGAVLLPAAVKVARISNISVSKLLMPMSFGTLVGGMATYLTTANILMSELLITRDIEGLSMLDFIPVGSIIVMASLLYMLLIGRRLLPERASLTESFHQSNLKDTYHLQERLWQVRVLPNSKLADKTVGEGRINAELGLTIAAVWRKGETITIPKPNQMIYPQDELLIVGKEERIEQLLMWDNVLIDDEAHSDHQELPIEPIEIMIAPRSDAINKTLSDMQLNSKSGLLAIALWRNGQSYHTDVRKMQLQVGDAVLVVGQLGDIQNLSTDSNYILPSGEYSELSIQRHKAPYAIVITAIVLVLGMFNFVPLPIAMLGGAVAMVITNCLTTEQFFQAIQWRVIFLIAGMLPLSIAITDTGLANRIGIILVDVLAGSSPLILIAGMVMLTMLVVQIIGGQVTALLVGPIAINATLQMGVDPRAMAVAVAMACSMAFLTPIAHPVNILMMGPGGYKFSDFFKVGLGMTVVTLGAMLLGLKVIWGI
jgi:di/tricarboxylate transporter